LKTELIWQATLKIWKTQTDQLHPGNPKQEDCSQLQAAVHQIFFEARRDPTVTGIGGGKP